MVQVDLKIIIKSQFPASYAQALRLEVYTTMAGVSTLPEGKGQVTLIESPS